MYTVFTSSTHFPCQILMEREFFPHIFEKYWNIKILTVGAELLEAHGRTNMMKLTVAFRNFANAPEIGNPGQ